MPPKKSTPTKKGSGSSSQQQQKDIIIAEQREEIECLKKEMVYLKKTVNIIKHEMNLINSKLEISSHVNDVLKSQLDELQQYSRRYSVLLDNVPARSNETTQEVENEVKNILINKFNCEEGSLSTEFDKAHRIGAKHSDNTQTIIIRFKSHSYRSNLYVERKNYQNRNGNRYKLRVSLTNSRRKLLSEVERKIENNEFVEFAYASVNGAIRIRTKEKFKNRNVFDIRTTEEIDQLLLRFNCNEAQTAWDDHNKSEYDDEL